MKIPEILKRRAAELEDYYRTHYEPLAPLVGQCFLNTIETTVKELEDGSYFVITGDIPAMWLRDSASQVKHYVRYAKDDPELQEILEGVISKQAELVCIDPYANAFNESANGRGYQDDTVRNPHVWERKYEVDSLCSPICLGYDYWKITGRTQAFTETFRNMIGEILRVFKVEQHHENSDYYFRRYHCRPSDTLPQEGRGTPVGSTGMTWSGFRPSDDSCVYGYLIPANMMAVVALGRAAEICRECYQDDTVAGECEKLRDEIREGISRYAIVDHPEYGKMYAYETDGLGNYLLMDDANTPSLLSLPRLGFCDAEDPIYRNTRKFVLSKDNPFYYEGTEGKGVGSPHTPEGFVWHIALVMQALTSSDREEILSCLEMLAKTHAGTNYMHESFHPDRPEEYTRSWFAWANSLFAELADNLMREGFFTGSEVS